MSKQFVAWARVSCRIREVRLYDQSAAIVRIHRCNGSIVLLATRSPEQALIIQYLHREVVALQAHPCHAAGEDGIIGFLNGYLSSSSWRRMLGR